MPKIRNAQDLEVRKQNTFLDRDSKNGKFQDIQQFVLDLSNVGDALKQQPENKDFAEKLNRFALNLTVAQLGEPSFKESQVNDALWKINQDLGKFLKEGGNYQRLVDAGKETGFLTQENLDKALGIIGGDMDLKLSLSDEEKEQSRQEEQRRQEELAAAELQAQNDLYALKVDMDEREKAQEELEQKQEEQKEQEPEKEGGLKLGGGKKKRVPEEEEELDEEELEEEAVDLDKTVYYGKAEKARKVNAKSYIEGRMRAVKGDKPLDVEDLAKIMAARELSGTKGGKAADLDVEVSQKAIEAKAQKLANNDQFKAWAQSLGKDGAREILSGRTHGGKMEKNFTKFLANRPIGELSNDKELERHMPTARERIEAIKSQLESNDRRNTGRKSYVQAMGAAEIIQIRRENHVQRGGAGLDRKIAVTDEPAKKLTATVEKKVQNYGMEALLADAAKAELIGKSRTHGGAMQDFVREMGRQSEFATHQDYAALDTRGGRMKELKAEARVLRGELRDAKEKDKPTTELMEKCRKNALEFYALNTGLMEPQGQLLPEPRRTQALEETIPWERTDKIMKVTEKDPAFQNVTKDADSMLTHMEKEILGVNLDPAQKKADEVQREIQQGDIGPLMGP